MYYDYRVLNTGTKFLIPERHGTKFRASRVIDDKILIGPKIGVWIAGGMAYGLNLIYYTDFEQSSLRIRPEFGLGLATWKLVYGYNIPLTNKNFEGVNNNNISLVVLFGIKKLKTFRHNYTK